MARKKTADETLKTTGYVRAERAIVRADSGGIRERWIWGLRLLNDPTAMSPNGGVLRQHVTQTLIEAARKAGLALSEREIRRRLQCARVYKTESQLGHAVADFGTWHDLSAEGFPPYPNGDGDVPFDWRTPDERIHAHARQLLDMAGVQGSLFPLDQFEPVRTTLADLKVWMVEQDGITASFVATGKKRWAYFNELERAAGGDLSVTWQKAHELARTAQPADVGD